jgi:hypothetical protein
MPIPPFADFVFNEVAANALTYPFAVAGVALLAGYHLSGGIHGGGAHEIFTLAAVIQKGINLCTKRRVFAAGLFQIARPFFCFEIQSRVVDALDLLPTCRIQDFPLIKRAKIDSAPRLQVLRR